MREAFHEELGEIDRAVATMTGLAANALRDASVALLEADMARADEAVRGADAIARRQEDLDLKVMDLFARQQPVAGDLRLLVAALRMSTDLERMGGLAVHLAQTARLRHPEHAIPVGLSSLVARMAAETAEMADGTAHLIAGRGLEAVRAIEDRDDTIDRLHRDLLTALLAPATGYDTRTAVDVTLVGRYYERFADHAVSIAHRFEFVLVGDAAGAAR